MNQQVEKGGAIIDGKAFAAALRATVTAQVSKLKAEHGITPGLAVVLAGDNPASQVYVRNKNKQTIEAGMNSFEHRPPDSISESELVALVQELNEDPKVNGILVQLPLPDQVSSHAVIASIDPAKDVDGFHTTNAGLLAVGGEGMVPCTPLGCMMLIKSVLGEDLSGQRALVLIIAAALLVARAVWPPRLAIVSAAAFVLTFPYQVMVVALLSLTAGVVFGGLSIAELFVSGVINALIAAVAVVAVRALELRFGEPERMAW